MMCSKPHFRYCHKPTDSLSPQLTARLAQRLLIQVPCQVMINKTNSCLPSLRTKGLVLKTSVAIYSRKFARLGAAKC